MFSHILPVKSDLARWRGTVQYQAYAMAGRELLCRMQSEYESSTIPYASRTSDSDIAQCRTVAGQKGSVLGICAVEKLTRTISSRIRWRMHFESNESVR
jgi:hypothetical protein